jgi:hypothetical protein
MDVGMGIKPAKKHITQGGVLDFYFIQFKIKNICALSKIKNFYHWHQKLKIIIMNFFSAESL